MIREKQSYFSQLRALSPLLGLALLSLASYGLGPELTRFDRSALAHGEWWRLISCHITHLGFNHLIINLAGLILIAALFCGLLGFYDWLLAIVFTTIGTGLCLFIFEPELQRYVGLSGILHGVILYACILSWPRQRFINSVLLLFVVAKLTKEYIWGPGEVEQFIGSSVLVMSHVYGALVGTLLGLGQLFLRALKQAR